MKGFLAAVAMLASLCAHAASGDPMTAEGLRLDCMSTKTAAQGRCISFVSGFIQGVAVGGTTPGNTSPVCPPHEMTNGDVRALFLKNMQSHPEVGSRYAGEVLGATLIAAYPCGRQR